MGVVPFRNATVPEGATPLLCVVTSAVNVTEPPGATVVGLAERLAVVAAFVIVRDFVAEVLDV